VPSQTLTLRIDHGTSPEWRSVTVLADGVDFVSGTRYDAFQGFDPGDLLGEDAPLLPGQSPRRVAVYRCSCGDSGCGVVAPLISREGDRVVWRDARDYTGVFGRPTVTDVPADSGSLAGVPDREFDAEQYEAEVRRASADRSWETPRRTASRLLRERLTRHADRLGHLGFRVDWVNPSWDAENGLLVCLLDGRGRQLILEWRTASSSPNDRAAEVSERMMSTPPAEWPVFFREYRREDA
jgi:hypothetical protein